LGKKGKGAKTNGPCGKRPTLREKKLSPGFHTRENFGKKGGISQEKG